MPNSNDIEVRFNTKELPLEYKLLECRLILNKELFHQIYFFNFILKANILCN